MGAGRAECEAAAWVAVVGPAALALASRTGPGCPRAGRGLDCAAVLRALFAEGICAARAAASAVGEEAFLRFCDADGDWVGVCSADTSKSFRCPGMAPVVEREERARGGD